MEMAWQKRKRSGRERDKEASQVAKDALQAANEAGSTVRNLYITFLLLGVYIGIIIAGTTDRQLLLISYEGTLCVPKPPGTHSVPAGLR